MLEKLIFLSLVLSISLYASTINIAVAANVSYAIDDLKKEFKKLYPKTKVRVTLGSSGKLTAQISHGAPYQIFMSANMKYPNSLYKNGLAITKPVVYAHGSLAFVSGKQKDFTLGMKLLQSSSIDKIAVANSKTAPYGIATAEALKNANIYKKIKHKFIYGESISQTLSYTIAAADIGVVAKSSLYSPKLSYLKKGIHWIDVDSQLYTPTKQGIVILKNGESNSEVFAFYNFMLSKKAQSILQKFGYIVP